MNIKEVPHIIRALTKNSGLSVREKQALEMALLILDKNVPKDAVGGKCPSCGREIKGTFCNCGQRIKLGTGKEWYDI